MIILLMLFTTNKLTDEHNAAVLNMLPGPQFTVTAIDSKKDIRTCQLTVKVGDGPP